MANTGLRIGEQVALQWKHIDTGRRILRIRRCWYPGGFAPPSRSTGAETSRCPQAWRRSCVAFAQPQARRNLSSPTGRARSLTLRTSSHGCSSLRPSALAKEGGSSSGGSPRHILGPAPRLSTHLCLDAFPAGVEREAGAGLARASQPGFTLSVYVHLLPGDMPSADFLDALTGSEGATVGQQITPKAAEVKRTRRGREAAREQGFLSPTEIARRLRGQFLIPRSKVRILQAIAGRPVERIPHG
jgi:hypothetical protein